MRTTTELLENLFNGIEVKQIRKAFGEAISAIAEQSKTNDDHGPEHIQVLLQVQEALLDAQESMEEEKKSEIGIEPFSDAVHEIRYKDKAMIVPQ